MSTKFILIFITLMLSLYQSGPETCENHHDDSAKAEKTHDKKQIPSGSAEEKFRSLMIEERYEEVLEFLSDLHKYLVSSQKYSEEEQCISDYYTTIYLLIMLDRDREALARHDELMKLIPSPMNDDCCLLVLTTHCVLLLRLNEIDKCIEECNKQIRSTSTPEVTKLFSYLYKGEILLTKGAIKEACDCFLYVDGYLNQYKKKFNIKPQKSLILSALEFNLRVSRYYINHLAADYDFICDKSKPDRPVLVKTASGEEKVYFRYDVNFCFKSKSTGKVLYIFDIKQFIDEEYRKTQEKANHPEDPFLRELKLQNEKSKPK